MTDLTTTQQIITIAMCVLATMATRFLPFMIFSDDKPTPKYIQFLGEALPAAIFAMLVVYCLKNVQFFSADGYFGFPEILALLATVAIQIWRKNMMLSMAVGTVLYMFLVQVVFI